MEAVLLLRCLSGEAAMREFDLKEVKKKLSTLVAEAALGDSFVITVNGKPMGKVVATGVKTDPPKATIPSTVP